MDKQKENLEDLDFSKSNEFDNLDTPQHVVDYTEFTFDVSDAISNYLKENGITDKEFASKIGVEEKEISRYLSGLCNFKIKTIFKLQKVMNVRLLYTAKEVDEIKKGFKT